MHKIGILHPGEMGISIAASALNHGHRVYWLSKGRSDRTRERAEKFNLLEIDSSFQFYQTCELIISICPPHAAEEVASSVSEAGFQGLYLDANAISPQRAIKIGRM
jgi:3-hydroxyisobutyrate dehydrogenase-like beta-hydroxyacid dehydrogenase